MTKVPAQSLRIIDNEAPLRGESPFLRLPDWESSLDPGLPRALRALARIVDGGLCHRCGSCVGICPTGVLALDRQEYPRVNNLSACTDCDLCVRVCPGDEFSWHDLNQETFGAPGDIAETHGFFNRATIAYAQDVLLRENSTSGGLVTALLVHLLEQGKIDGAVVIASDDQILWKGRPIVARSREELLSSTKSKYAIASTNSMLAEVRNRPGRYALVGLPCQIHGFIKAARLDERVRERVVLTIGLVCHAAIEHEAYDVIWQSLGERAAQAQKFISRVGKHPGTPHLLMKDGSQYPVYFGERRGYRPSSLEVINILYRLYTPARCLTCFDAMSEFADITVGDPWLAPPEDDVDFYQGWSFAMLRTARGEAAYDSALEAGCIRDRTLTRNEALACNSMMAHEKRTRAFRVIETRRRQGKSIPQYGPPDLKFPALRGMAFVKTEIHMLTHVFCFIPRMRARILSFMLGRGYWLFWLNNFRRVFRFWRRDTLAWLRRKLFGRQ